MNAATAEAPTRVDPADLARLDFEIECEADHCPAPAAWWSVCRLCRHSLAICHEHRARSIAEARWSLVGCRRCRVFVADWRDLFEWIPIGGA